MKSTPVLRPLVRHWSELATRRRVRRLLFVGAVALTVALPVIAQQKTSEPVFIEGDEGTMRRENGQDVLELQGNVHFRHGTTTVESRRALQVGPRNAAQIFFYDNVRIEEGVAIMRGAEGEYSVLGRYAAPRRPFSNCYARRHMNMRMTR